MARLGNYSLNGNDLIGINPGNAIAIKGIPIGPVNNIVDCDILQYNANESIFSVFRSGLISRFFDGTMTIRDYKVLLVRNPIEVDEDVLLNMEEKSLVIEL